MLFLLAANAIQMTLFHNSTKIYKPRRWRRFKPVQPVMNSFITRSFQASDTRCVLMFISPKSIVPQLCFPTKKSEIRAGRIKKFYTQSLPVSCFAALEKKNRGSQGNGTKVAFHPARSYPLGNDWILLLPAQSQSPQEHWHKCSWKPAC